MTRGAGDFISGQRGSRDFPNRAPVAEQCNQKARLLPRGDMCAWNQHKGTLWVDLHSDADASFM